MRVARWVRFCLLGGTLVSVGTAVAEDAPPAFNFQTAVFLRVSPAGRLELQRLEPDAVLPPRTPAGILIWRPIRQRERWQLLTEGGTWPEDPGGSQPPVEMVGRGELQALGGLPAGGLNVTTVQLEPLDGSVLTRGATFVTPPHQAQILSRRPTLRRLTGTADLKAAVAIIRRSEDQSIVLRVPFAENQAEFSLEKWKDWPASMPEGLPPGRYSLQLAESPELADFTIISAEHHQAVFAPIRAMQRALLDATDPLGDLFAVEVLLGHQDDAGQPLYLSDALDWADRSSVASTAPALARLRSRLREWLDHQARNPGVAAGRVSAEAEGVTTGIAAIDEIRGLIAAGRWTEAWNALESIEVDGEAPAQQRLRGLRALYRGVILAEGASVRVDQAEAEFLSAIDLLPGGPPEQRSGDLIRAWNNAGNYRLRLAQNGLSQQGFATAAGVDQPLLDAFEHLLVARERYTAALQAAETAKDAATAAAIRVNLARTAAVSAELLQTLQPGGASSGFAAGLKAALAEARESLTPVLAVELDADKGAAEPKTRAAAAELQAQLAYRSGDRQSACDWSQQARANYLNLGDLGGVETCERLLGLAALAERDPTTARRHLIRAGLLADLQRNRFPQNRAGMSRSGYFARHHFVFEKLIELALADQQPLQALALLEESKARTAQDYLSGLESSGATASIAPRATAEWLADWPADLAAVEYFLGAEQAWVFLIQGGQVTAYRLLNDQGAPLASRALVTQVQTALKNMEGQSLKIQRRHASKKGFDHSWQDELAALRNYLLPDELLDRLRTASRVLIVPQHILHYLPFSALVTTRDTSPRGQYQMVQPRFILDEPYDLTAVPSLTIWDQLRRRPSATITEVRAVGVVDAPEARPIEGVKIDLDNLRQVYGARVQRILSGAEATETQIADLFAQPGLLQICSHGINQADRPADSYLLVMPEAPEAPALIGSSGINSDGHLTAREIFTQEVRSDLVVLSACYSGLGDASPQPGDDLFGLQRAFLYAGARNVVAGLWDVDDGSAPVLLRSFHERIVQGESPTHALAQAQREFLKTYRTRTSDHPWLHPYFWAMFSATGAN